MDETLPALPWSESHDRGGAARVLTERALAHLDAAAAAFAQSCDDDWDEMVAAFVAASADAIAMALTLARP